jgi:hypothetical protein
VLGSIHHGASNITLYAGHECDPADIADLSWDAAGRGKLTEFGDPALRGIVEHFPA